MGGWRRTTRDECAASTKQRHSHAENDLGYASGLGYRGTPDLIGENVTPRNQRS